MAVTLPIDAVPILDDVALVLVLAVLLVFQRVYGRTHLRRHGIRMRGVHPADVGTLEDNDRAVAAAVSEFGRLDVVVLNAAVSGQCGFDNFTEQQYGTRCASIWTVSCTASARAWTSFVPRRRALAE